MEQGVFSVYLLPGGIRGGFFPRDEWDPRHRPQYWRGVKESGMFAERRGGGNHFLGEGTKMTGVEARVSWASMSPHWGGRGPTKLGGGQKNPDAQLKAAEFCRTSDSYG